MDSYLFTYQDNMDNFVTDNKDTVDNIQTEFEKSIKDETFDFEHYKEQLQKLQFHHREHVSCF